MDPRRPQQVQQIEVIEHIVEEGRRPVSLEGIIND
jgi:hypothetical protein